MSYTGPERRKKSRRLMEDRRGDMRWFSEALDRRVGLGRRLADVPKTLTR